ncbi:MAG TPA: hypothetical protein VN455_06570, partial [Methanotrichaceae archaeon]|nr:hypothetical protein [Methanotrichaceae archaeon]
MLISRSSNPGLLIALTALALTLWASSAAAYPGQVPIGPGDDVGLYAQQTKDGGYVIAGYSGDISGGDFDTLLIKTDAKGDMLWNRTYEVLGDNYSNYGYAVKQTADGGYIIAGYTKSSSSDSYDALLIKTDSDGAMQWNKTYGEAWSGNEYGYSVAQASDGGYVLIGGTTSPGTGANAGTSDALLIKTDSDGNMLWNRTVGTQDSESEVAYSAEQTRDGGYILAGTRSSPDKSRGSDILLAKLSSEGAEEWNSTIGSDLAGEERASSVQQTKDGGYVLAGWTNSSGTGTFDALVVKTDAMGKTEWNKSIGASDMGNEAAYSLQQTSDGGYIIAGSKNATTPGEGEDILAIKLDANGNESWTKTFGSDWKGEEKASSIIQSEDGGYILAGWTTSIGDSSSDVLLAKLDGQGNAEWHKV